MNVQKYLPNVQWIKSGKLNKEESDNLTYIYFNEMVIEVLKLINLF